MIFYISLYFFILLFFFFSFLVKSSFIYRFIVLIIIFISGTRYMVGFDFLNYIGFYIENTSSDALEPLFNLSLILLNYFSSNPQWMFFIYSLFTIALVSIILPKYTNNYRMAFLIYLLIPGLFLNTFTIIRFSLAQSILFFAMYYFIYRNNYYLFFIMAFISIGFHYSALIPIVLLIILYPLLKIKFSFIIYLTLIVFSLIFYIFDLSAFLLSFLGGKYEYYQDSEYTVSLLKLIVINLYFLILIFFRNYYINTIQETIIFNFTIIGVLLINLFAEYTFITRISYYFLIFQIILVPKFIYSFKGNYKIAILLFCMLFYLLQFINALQFSQKEDKYPNIIPYKNYFWEIK